MSKKRYDDFDVLDDYYEEEGDPFLFSQSVGSDFSNVSYDEFNKARNEYEDDDDDVVYVEEKPTYHHKTTIKKKTKRSSSLEDRMVGNETLMDVLNVFWVWFRRLGVVIAVILIAYYIVKGYFQELFSYLFALVVAFFFGFGFMALLTKAKENR